MATNARQTFLDAYEREHATTMRVLRAFPSDKAEFRPHAKSKTARELAWVFVMERGLGMHVLRDEIMERMKKGEKSPETPAKWEAVLAALEKAHTEFADFVGSMNDAELDKTSTFFVGPKTPGPVRRGDFLWFLLHDQIHHRGQLSIYLRMVDGKVPSIYGPTADEPWT
jgi:uncharacterized damage-inducible protein DinB